VIEVLTPGPFTTVQDSGRVGWAHLGVPVAGPADWLSHLLANRLVGNRDGAAALEVTAAGPTLRVDRDTAVAVVGASLQVDDEPAPTGRTVLVPAGSRVTVGGTDDVRAYLAVAGGIDVPPVLGSRSADTLSGLGPGPLAAGDVLAVAPADLPPVWMLDRHALPQRRDALRVIAGPHADWFTEQARRAFAGGSYDVSPSSDRVGVRLDGPRLARSREGELPTEGMATGALQVPPDGAPILLLANHGATGGYPVIGVVVRADLPAAGQLRPGATVQFTVVERDQAVAAYLDLRAAADRAVVVG
jgi:biotin-dependent carboxylase-like uncharacterized protein